MRLFLIIVILGMFGACFYVGMKYGRADLAEEITAATDKAAADARAKEKELQRAANEITQKQMDDMAAINAGLVDDIIRLQSRKSRADLPETTQATCQGATGRELSSNDAEFLTREAARADTIRAALKACYEYTDKVK